MNIFYLIGFYFGRAKFELARGLREGFAPPIPEKDREIRILLMQDPEKNYIPAIKLHRTLHNSSLRDAKDAVDLVRTNIGYIKHV